MNIKRLLAVAVAAVFIGGMPCEAKTENTIRKDRKTLEKENAQLKAKMDSLKMELERYRCELHIADSINNEMVELYEGEAGKE